MPIPKTFYDTEICLNTLKIFQEETYFAFMTHGYLSAILFLYFFFSLCLFVLNIPPLAQAHHGKLAEYPFCQQTFLDRLCDRRHKKKRKREKKQKDKKKRQEKTSTFLEEHDH